MAIFEEEKWVDWIDQMAQHDFVVIGDFLPLSAYEKLKSYLNKKLDEQQFDKAGIGALADNQIVTRIRGDETFWLDRERDRPEIQEFYDLVEEMIAHFNRLCYMSLSGFEFHFAHYPQGTFYKKHVDQFRDRSNRLITFILYFNDEWKDGDGGELVIYHEDGERTIEPSGNNCVMFRTEGMEHEVRLSHASRFSLTGWLLYQPTNVGYIMG